MARSLYIFYSSQYGNTYTLVLFLQLTKNIFCPCSIISRHKTLEGLSQGSVEYQALQLVSSLEHYGVEWHWARDADGQRMAIGVGPEGIAICKEDFSLVNRYNDRHL